ncbi:hypothetical protein BDR06DRAFT_963541 [Suillus hirtellus]|nr:hypothetical protein BDR06DRAFT_963541 [Suillus hirtellus]
MATPVLFMIWSLHPVLVHCLSDEARQLAFVNMSDLADLHSMTPAERKILTPFTRPFIRVSAKGEELPSRCLNGIFHIRWRYLS